jgi:dolichyl-phosphate-mannose-protein mannosyltransferase
MRGPVFSSREEASHLTVMLETTQKARLSTRLRQGLLQWVRWKYFWPTLIVAISLALHFAIINQPKELVFDEVHYITDAKSIINDHTTLRAEHPPLGKLFIVSGVLIFGDNPIGWRFPSVIFGAAGIFLFYLICRQLALSKRASLLATSLLALENLTFVQASLAMLDVFSVTLMLLSFWLYLKGYYPLAAVSVALAALAKLTGVLALPAIILHWLLARRDRPVHFSASMVLAPVSFVMLLLPLDFAVYRHFIDPIQQIRTMLAQMGSLTFTTASHPYMSRPWDWVLLPKIMPYWYLPHYTGVISFTIWALIIPAVVYMAVLAVRKNSAGLFGLVWFISTYLFWIPTSLLTNRISFIYYFYPTIGAICLGLGMGLSRLIDVWQTRKTGKLRLVAFYSVVVFLVLQAGVFAALYPVMPWPRFLLP